MGKTNAQHDETLPENVEEHVPAILTDGEVEIIEYFNDLNEFLETPFVQPRAIAQSATAYTIIKAGRRTGKRVDNDEDVEQFVYLVELEDDIKYTNNARQHKAFNKGDRAIIALQVNNIRQQNHDKIKGLLEKYSSLPHMTAREIAPSGVKAAKGWGPSVALCHKTQWRELKGE